MLKLKEKEVHMFNVNQVVLNKIREEEKNHPFREFGGWLLVQNGEVIDIIFDMQFASGGSVDFGVGVVKAVDSKHRKMVRGWFHKHPMVNLSGTDESTLVELTKFWNECYTMVLQSNGNMLLMKTIPTTKPKKESQQVSQRPAILPNEPTPFSPPKVGRSLALRFFNNFRNTAKYIDCVATNSPPIITTEDRQKNETDQQPPYNKFGYGWCQWRSPMEDVDIVFKGEIPFGVVQFIPTYDDKNRKIKLSIPKMECISDEMTFGDLLELNAFRFYSQTASYTFNRLQLSNLLQKRQLNVLMYSGVIDIENQLLYEGDVVSFITPWNNIEQKGKVTFSSGKWGITIEPTGILFKKSDIIDLDDRISLKRLHNMFGGI